MGKFSNANFSNINHFVILITKYLTQYVGHMAWAHVINKHTNA